MKVLLTGANGQLGRCLQDRAEQERVTFIATDRQELDITSETAVAELVLKEQPQLIINAAAYTAVDKAESEYETALAVNANGPVNLAKAAAVAGIPLLHVSTDYVFDGNGTEPYLPEQQTSPLGVYGETKWAGEKMVRQQLDKHVIVRTAWVVSEYGNNFAKTILRLGKERDELSVIADQYGCPTYAGDLADALLVVVKGISAGRQEWGTFHHCGDQPTSWHGFARAILAEAKTQGKIESMPKLYAIKTEDYPLPAPRPTYSVMDCNSMLSIWGVGPSNWRNSLKTIIAKL
ncbi:dTDP-4-dehydrorhamnose reductase [Vibrio sp. SM6]|uniref:dTDP-4-dehydrorhamnose reductase n=1 Tax=Vibrio agarilyticus TaxID=2726741 RepID=A0A7X8TRN4_9VIBR|nr:dTDP-4-dehydrorhamnose reductase [Vibrio agarilyticus]NLS13519.1 dTDP-4-dehydrorhamnose reductase [Vibrio agarilyticus]